MKKKRKKNTAADMKEKKVAIWLKGENGMRMNMNYRVQSVMNLVVFYDTFWWFILYLTLLSHRLVYTISLLFPTPFLFIHKHIKS